MTSSLAIIGIDGLRWDVLGELPTPNLDRIARDGFSAPVRIPPACPTISGPTWTTILTGVLPNEHGIYANQLSPNHLDVHPQVFALAADQRPNVATWAGAGWLPLVSSDSGGPLIPGGWAPPGPQAHSRDQWEATDAAVTEAAVEFISQSTSPALVFCYLGGVDEVGHAHGVGDDYRDFTVRTDTRVGLVLDAIEARRAQGERWTVIAVTDHGHIDAGGHGGDSDEERTAWIIANGPEVPDHPPTDLAQADVAAHVHLVCALTAPPGVVGRPFNR